MGLEESEGTERVGQRCEECGATLTPDELRVALESGGPALCSVHAAEAEALPDDDA
jgi:methionyl-tRNA synthetase